MRSKDCRFARFLSHKGQGLSVYGAEFAFSSGFQVWDVGFRKFAAGFVVEWLAFRGISGVGPRVGANAARSRVSAQLLFKGYDIVQIV